MWQCQRDPNPEATEPYSLASSSCHVENETHTDLIQWKRYRDVDAKHRKEKSSPINWELSILLFNILAPFCSYYELHFETLILFITRVTNVWLVRWFWMSVSLSTCQNSQWWPSQDLQSHNKWMAAPLPFLLYRFLSYKPLTVTWQGLRAMNPWLSGSIIP